MRDFLFSLKSNPFAYRFLIIFSVFFGTGILWAVIVVLTHITRPSKIRTALKELRFFPVSNNFGVLEELKNGFLRKVHGELTASYDKSGRLNLLKCGVSREKITVDYRKKDIPGELPVPAGLIERGRLLRIKFVISRPLYRSSLAVQAYFAGVRSSVTTEYYRRTSTRIFEEWTLFFFGKTPFPSRVIISPAFTGWQKAMVDSALNLMKIDRPRIEGLLPEFEEKFIAAGEDEPGLSLPEKTQKKILASQAFRTIPRIRLVLDPKGAWLSGPIWPKNGEEFKGLVSLCEALIV
ncbi:MAG TPA: hypothetical protein VJC03_06645 [bacterium]|nr:hypothetical protein [bacterium]